MILAALVIIFFWKKGNRATKKLKNKLLGLLFTVGILGLVYIFARQEGIGYLNSRVVLLSISILFILWTLEILLYRIFTVPKEIKKLKEEKNLKNTCLESNREVKSYNITISKKGY